MIQPSGEARAWQPAGDRELEVGLAGLGTMGRNHLRVLAAINGVRIAGVADPVRALVEDATSATNIAAFTDPETMLAECQLDALVIATPTMSHRAIALHAIERGVAVLVEKPLAGDPRQCMDILRAARVSGVPVQVGHVERFNPAVRELGRLLKAGWLSTVYSITSRRAGPFPDRIRDVGVTVDLATHDVDILSWIAGERPVSVHAETARRIHGQHEDLMFGLLQFPSGATGMLDVNWLTPAKRRQLVVVGEEGMFELDYLTQRLTFTRASSLERPRLIDGYAPTFEGEMAELPVPNGEPLVLEDEAFIDMVREGGRPEVDAVDGLWSVAIASALLSAAGERRVVELAEVPDLVEVS